MQESRRRLAVLFTLALLAGCSTLRGPQIAPPQAVDMDPEALTKFQNEVEEYVELHQDLLKRVPTVSSQLDPAEMARTAEDGGRDTGRATRRKQGDIFKPRWRRPSWRRSARSCPDPRARPCSRRCGPATPGRGYAAQSTRRARTDATSCSPINAVYPDGAPCSGVPSSLLLALPRLPEQVKYGFIGRALVLRETEADLILDFIRDVVPDPGLPR